MAVFKLAVCECGNRKRDPKPTKKPPLCPKCGADMTYRDNWYISYQVAGSKRTEAIGPQRRLAEDALAKKRVEIREGRFFDKLKDISWEDAKKIFCRWMQTNVRPNTIKQYDNSLSVLDKYFSGKTLMKIGAEDIEAFKIERLQAGKYVGKKDKRRDVTHATVNRDLAVIKRVFSLCEEWGKIEYNKIAKVKLLNEGEGRTRFLTEEEIKRLLEEAKNVSSRLHMAVTIALDTGLRKETILTLQWSDIDFNQNEIKKESKGGKIVRVPLTERLKSTLLAWRQEQWKAVASPYVIPSAINPNEPTRVDSFKSFRSACKKAGIENFRFHDLRHTFASHFLMKTRDLRALQEILAHSDIKTTMRYAHLLDEHKKRAMEVFEKGEAIQ